MIELRVHGVKICNVDKQTIMDILTVYPDEQLRDRPIFKKCLETEILSIYDLKNECQKLFLPWQLFLLDNKKAKRALEAINKRRRSKFNMKSLANRPNSGQYISSRILDKILKLQEFAENNVVEKNTYCGLLKGINGTLLIKTVSEFFDLDALTGDIINKEKYLNTIIEKIEKKNIRVSQGVYSYVLPQVEPLRSLYKETSGFVVHGDKVPYIFLPGDINKEETLGRQALTLVSLVIMLGCGRYSAALSDRRLSQLGHLNNDMYAIERATEILFPLKVSGRYESSNITPGACIDLSRRYMLTPTAIAISFKTRGNISEKECNILLKHIESSKKVQPKTFGRSPKVTSVVNKFCGKTTAKEISDAIRAKTIKNIEAQYLLFGRINKNAYKKYYADISI